MSASSASASASAVSGGASSGGSGIGAPELAAECEQVLTLLRQHPEGVNQNMVQDFCSSLDNQTIVRVINQLSDAFLVTMFMDEVDNVWWKLMDESIGRKFQMLRGGATSEDMMVYQEIERAGSNSLWKKIIKDRTGLQTQALTKILKKLENAQLIKRVPSIGAKTHLHYMLFDLVPGLSITGGPWYSQQGRIREFDELFVEESTEQVMGIIRQRGPCTTAQIREALQSSRLTEDSHVQLLVNRLVDGSTVERCVPPAKLLLTGQEAFYREAPVFASASCALADVPCGVCPVAGQCVEGGIISPSTCHYMNCWLEL